MPVEMLGSSIFLPATDGLAEEFFVAGLDHTPLLPGMRIVVGLFDDGMLCVGVFIVMSRRRLVTSALIKQRGSLDVAAAGHGGRCDGRWVQLAERA